MSENLTRVGRIVIGLNLLLLSLQLQAAIDVYQFNKDTDRERFQYLVSELRCPKCQNQNIADSNAEIARDLRAKIHTMLSDGRSDDEIIDYMTARYGEFVLYEPRVSIQTYLLWFGPAILLVLGILVILWIVRRNARQTSQEPTGLDQEQQHQLDDLLKDNDK